MGVGMRMWQEKSPSGWPPGAPTSAMGLGAEGPGSKESSRAAVRAIPPDGNRVPSGSSGRVWVLCPSPS